MTATLIDGRKLARDMRSRVAREVAALDRQPGLATILVGDDPASGVYVANKRRLCTEVGFRDHHRHESANITQEQLGKVINDLNTDPDVNGILLQLPLPDHLDSRALIDRIDPSKDIDGLTEVSVGRLAQDRPGLAPCTPSGVMSLLDHAGVEIAGSTAAVIGRSELVGRPQAHMLLARDATVTSCHIGTRNIRAVTREADILVAAAGVPHLISPDDVKPGATVIDVGIHRTEHGLHGDVQFDAVAAVAGRITPVPGGVGPMTIAWLLQNTLTAARTLSADREGASR